MMSAFVVAAGTDALPTSYSKGMLILWSLSCSTLQVWLPRLLDVHSHTCTSPIPTVNICLVFLDATLRPHNADATVSIEHV